MAKSINGNGPPTSKTRAQIGDFYIDQESQTVYKCTNIIPSKSLDYGFIDVHQGHDNEYEWELVDQDKTIYLTDGYYMFYQGTRLDMLPYIDVRHVRKFDYMFASADIPYEKFPLLDTSNGVTFKFMCQYNDVLTQGLPLDVSNGTDVQGMYANCPNLERVPDMNTSNVTNFIGMFNTCPKLLAAPKMNTAKGEMFGSMFSKCWALKTVPCLDLGNVGDAYSAINYIFDHCVALTNLNVYNIRKSMQIGSGTSWGHLLTVDSLVHTIKELCTVTAQQTLTMGSANLAKITDLYCKITDDTNEKLTMELCESTDEGAITLEEYAAEKNWLLA